LDDDKWFQPVSDFDERFNAACSTEQRKQAWGLLPENQPLTLADVSRIVKSVMSSKGGSVKPWWEELKRQRLLLSTGQGDTYVKAKPEFSSGGK
jgi:hypothetical protein